MHAVRRACRRGRAVCIVWIGRRSTSDVPVPLQPGLADEREFPHALWARCLRRAARNALRRQTSPSTTRRCSQALLRHLAEHRGIKANPDQIVVVPTAQAGLALIAKVLLERR